MSLSKRRSLALFAVRKFFPQVNTVEDADKPLEVEVTDSDVKKSAKKDHTECAMAVACKRVQHADGVIISIRTAYVIKGDKAVRYTLPEHTAREVVSFDRSTIFSPGDYALRPPSPTQSLGARSYRGGKKGGGNHASSKKRRKPHVTEGIRTVLGSKFVA